MEIVDVEYDSTHYYVLSLKGRPKLLIDVGMPGTLAKLQHQCKRAGVPLTDLKHMVCTHFHPDHAGLVSDLLPLGVRLILVDIQRGAAASVKPEYGAVKVDAALMTTLGDSRVLLAQLGIAGQFVATPGHSDDSISVVLDSGAAFIGDLPPLFMAAEDSAAVLQASWDRLRACGATTIYPGHGSVWKLG